MFQHYHYYMQVPGCNCAFFVQAVEAVNAFNGEEIAGRKILVREDREDRDVKQYNKENGIERPNTRRPKRGGRGANGAGRGDQGGRGGPPQEVHQSSGLQASPPLQTRAARLWGCPAMQGLYVWEGAAHCF